MMNNKNYQAIIDALDLLVKAKPAKSNGKVTAVNLAKEAGISKATLYRYFEEFPELRRNFDNSRKNFKPFMEEPTETIEHAIHLLKLEVKQLRSELTETKRRAEINNKLKAHQILILWTDNNRLQEELSRLQKKALIDF